MIIELTKYEPQDGRQYSGPAGGDLPAIERLRIDCCEVWYTKVKAKGRTGLKAAAVVVTGPAASFYELNMLVVNNHAWAEAILLRYRCTQEDQQHYTLAVGYALKLYGPEPPTELRAELGPKVTVEDHDATL